MRRFEFVQGSSAKFWMTDVQGNAFVVVYGRLGTSGQRKEKDFPSPDAARREMEKKIAEKLREGYQEVSATAAAAAPAGAKGAAAAAAPLELPPRLVQREATPERIQAAIESLNGLAAARGRRSWALNRRLQHARRALERIAGVVPSAHPALERALDGVLERVIAPRAGDRVPLVGALQLLLQVDASAFAKVMDGLWKLPPPGHPTAPALKLASEQLGALNDPELSLRIIALLLSRPAAPATGWSLRWRKISPHLEAYLARSGSSLKKYLGSIDPSGDPHLTGRIEAMRAG
ncbi:WGR domain-containing protein [Chondromyces crocatus]|uniref:Molybdenum metabolism regulator n=1 Tax=Chondromyces crocatus TaxID=52 RepID=A0A0K1EHR6_CHOCO|nr:WGR domain-containing protein [Chondromyces crocatus]AKT40400.1 molybdenum metabolism regulator [Chondromyces crocatus]